MYLIVTSFKLYESAKTLVTTRVSYMNATQRFIIYFEKNLQCLCSWVIALIMCVFENIREPTTAEKWPLVKGSVRDRK
jgi:hypothetical protein